MSSSRDELELGRQLLEQFPALTIDEVVQGFCDGARRVLAARYFGLRLDGVHGGPAAYFSGFNADTVALISRPNGRPNGRNGVVDTIVENEGSFRVASIQGDAPFGGFPDHHPRMTSLVAARIRVDERTVGTVCAADRVDGRPF